jgi:hypothetical protein
MHQLSPSNSFSKVTAKPNSREVVLPVPRSDRTEVSEKTNVWSDKAGGGGDIQGVVSAVWVRPGGGARDGGSCPHVLGDTTEVQRGEHGGEVERQGSDHDSPEVQLQAEFRGAAFPARILCKHAGAG